jgi:hypothetical protein
MDDFLGDDHPVSPRVYSMVVIDHLENLKNQDGL